MVDVLRFGTENIQGSARYQAMSGAFGALGGEIGSIHSNPAGSALFNNSKITFSATGYIYDNRALYFENEETKGDYTTEFNQAGGVFILKNNNKDSRFKKFSIGFNYDRAANFNNEIVASGVATNSIADYFLNYARGLRFADIVPAGSETPQDAYINIGSDPGRGFNYQQAFLGYQAVMFLPDAYLDDNTGYYPNVNFVELNQRFQVASEGANNKYTFNTAFQYTPNFYFGASFNFYDLNYTRLTLFDETGYEPVSPIQEVYFDNLMTTTGKGLSFTVGALSKIKNFRVGVSYQSPVWWNRMQEKLQQGIYSNIAPATLADISAVVNIFPEYKMQIPAKITGSAAVVFGKQGALSFDYSYQDFSKALLKPTSDTFFQTQNSIISNRLDAVSTYRVGGEYRLQKFSLRAGYRWEGSPYKDPNAGSSEIQGYSFGLGYNFGGTQLDASFNQYRMDQNNTRFFDAGFLNNADINAKNTNVTVTLSFNL